MLTPKVDDEDRKLGTAESVFIGDEKHRCTADDETYRGTVVSTEADMVARVLRNPEGFVSEKGGLYSYRLDLAVASGHLPPTHDELSRLRRRGRVGSIMLDGYAAARFWRDGKVHPFLTGE